MFDLAMKKKTTKKTTASLTSLTATQSAQIVGSALNAYLRPF